jgi:hypothetical protein
MGLPAVVVGVLVVQSGGLLARGRDDAAALISVGRLRCAGLLGLSLHRSPDGLSGPAPHRKRGKATSLASDRPTFELGEVVDPRTGDLARGPYGSGDAPALDVGEGDERAGVGRGLRTSEDRARVHRVPRHVCIPFIGGLVVKPTRRT